MGAAGLTKDSVYFISLSKDYLKHVDDKTVGVLDLFRPLILLGILRLAARLLVLYWRLSFISPKS
jgi:hypothetical protein